MKPSIRFNQIALTTLIVGGLIAVTAIFSGYSGLIELQCSPEGCGFVIDGRNESP